MQFKYSNLRKPLAIAIAGIAILAGFVVIPRTGEIIWQTTRLADAAVFLERDARFALEIGNYYFNVDGNGEYDLNQAEKYYDIALARDPNLNEARYQLSRIAFLYGDFDAALALINEHFRREPEFKRAHYVRGLIYGYRGDLDAAADDFKAFLEWDPTSWAGANDLAWIYFRKGEYAKVRAAAESGLISNPNNAWLLTSLGVSLVNLGRMEEARSTLERAKQAADGLSESDWQKAYPGNDPAIAAAGLENMKRTIEFNLGLIKR